MKEIKSKYKKNSEKLLKMIDSVYRWIPLGTIIDKKVLVVHGGISDLTDLDCIKRIERQKVSIRFYILFTILFPSAITRNVINSYVIKKKNNLPLSRSSLLLLSFSSFRGDFYFRFFDTRQQLLLLSSSLKYFFSKIFYS